MRSSLGNRGLSVVAERFAIQKIPPPGSENWDHAKMLAGLAGATRNTRASLQSLTNTYARRQANIKLQRLMMDVVGQFRVSFSRQTPRRVWDESVDREILACLRRGADPNSLVGDGFGPDADIYHPLLNYACIDRRNHLVKALLDLGADPNKRYVFREWQVLENPVLVNMLLDAGASPDATDPDLYDEYESGLELASAEGELDTVRAFLGKGAQLRDSMAIAAEMGNWEIVQELLRAGADPNVALESAVCQNDDETVDVLLAAGADPLDFVTVAAKYGYVATVKALLRAGAEVEQEAWELAAENGHEHVLQILRQHGLEPPPSP